MMGQGQGAMSGGMMGGAGGHMSGGMMSGMMGGMMGQMMVSQSGSMMGDMHSDNPLTFSEALELRDEQIKQLRELQLSYAHSLVDAQAAIRKSELDVQAARTQPEDLRNLEQALRAAAEARIALELLQARQAEGVSIVLTSDQREKWSNLRNGGGCNMAIGDGDISTGTAHAAHHPPPTP